MGVTPSMDARMSPCPRGTACAWAAPIPRSRHMRGCHRRSAHAVPLVTMYTWASRCPRVTSARTSPHPVVITHARMSPRPRGAMRINVTLCSWAVWTRGCHPLPVITADTRGCHAIPAVATHMWMSPHPHGTACAWMSATPWSVPRVGVTVTVHTQSSPCPLGHNIHMDITLSPCH